MSVFLSLLRKDLRIELRQKEGIVVGVSLGVLLATIAYFGVQSAFLKPEYEQALLPALVWILFLFAATSSQSRSFDHELEYSAIDAVLRRGVSPELIYAAKLIVALVVLALVFFAVFSSLFIFLNLSLAVLSPALAVCSTLVLFGYASLGVLFTALTGRSRLSTLLYPVVFLPLLFPLFFAGVELYAALLVDNSFSWSSPWVSLLIGADVVYFLLGFNLFRFVIRDQS